MSTREEYWVDTTSVAFTIKRLWFRDVLRAPRARCFLWSLYYAGEAYAELHPDEVFIARLASPLDRLLARHLDDETRHATVFRRLLAAEGESPWPLAPHEDLGFHLLTNVVPDVVAAARDDRPFTRVETMRYMAFLHALESRSIGDLVALREAARSVGDDGLASDLAGILGDERFHASYTHRAFHDLAGDEAEARACFDAIRRAERHHYGRALRRYIERFRQLGAVPRDTAGRLRWAAMAGLARAGLHGPLLPQRARLPRELAPNMPNVQTTRLAVDGRE